MEFNAQYPAKNDNPYKNEVKERTAAALDAIAADAVNGPLLPTPESRTRAAQRLLSGSDSILRNPTFKRGNEADEQTVYDVVNDTSPYNNAFTEEFRGGQLVYVDKYPAAEQFVVALVNWGEVQAVVTTDDQGDADAFYAGMAEELNLLNERCEGCGTPIPIVYQVCRNCV